SKTEDVFRAASCMLGMGNLTVFHERVDALEKGDQKPDLNTNMASSSSRNRYGKGRANRCASGAASPPWSLRSLKQDSRRQISFFVHHCIKPGCQSSCARLMSQAWMSSACASVSVS